MICILSYLAIGLVLVGLMCLFLGFPKEEEGFGFVALCLFLWPILFPVMIGLLIFSQEGRDELRKFIIKTNLKSIHKNQFELQISFLGIDKLSKMITVYKDGEVWRDSKGYKFPNQEKLNSIWTEQEEKIKTREIKEKDRKEFLKREFEMRETDF